MPRIRSVHPGLFTDEAFAQLSDAAQIFWIGLWTEADDQGVFEWKPITLKMRLRPASLSPVEPLLEELQRFDCIKPYEANGRRYGAIRNFGRFQRPKKPNSVHPVPPEFRTYLGLEARGSEPEADDGATVPPKEEPVTPDTPSGGENAPQMEEVGGKREEVKESKQPRAPVFVGREQFVTTEASSGKQVCGGFYLNDVQARVFAAARIDDARWRGDIGPLIDWLGAEKIAPDIIVSAIGKVADRPAYKVPDSLNYFSKPVHEEHGRRPR